MHRVALGLLVVSVVALHGCKKCGQGNVFCEDGYTCVEGACVPGSPLVDGGVDTGPAPDEGPPDQPQPLGGLGQACSTDQNCDPGGFCEVKVVPGGYCTRGCTDSDCGTGGVCFDSASALG